MSHNKGFQTAAPERQKHENIGEASQIRSIIEQLSLSASRGNQEMAMPNSSLPGKSGGLTSRPIATQERQKPQKICVNRENSKIRSIIEQLDNSNFLAKMKTKWEQNTKQTPSLTA